MSDQEGTTKLLKDVIEKADLKNVYAKSSFFNMFSLPESIEPQNTKIEIDYSFEHQVFKDEPYELICFVNTKITAKPKENTELHKAVGDKKVFESACTFAARYKLTDADVSDEACKIFTRLNGLFNTYPFIREHIHASFSKMGIQGFFLPLLKPHKKSTDKKEAETT